MPRNIQVHEKWLPLRYCKHVTAPVWLPNPNSLSMHQQLGLGHSSRLKSVSSVILSADQRTLESI